ncbi:methyl-accepting chemotaxis protein [Gynuella sp.]|uniref:methyl-accepting chemotaxis protein n=1 Tax=Gynuella sp. TaxID=2969146 RepID=UPI003D09889D
MRQNLPVKDQEIVLADGEELVSATNVKGQISFCNDTFLKISGFNREELIGQPHNIVRHPDMPPLAFNMLWNTIKTGKPWMGLVKNRCKDGSYYWVDAYVTPVLDQGKVIGFESVRFKPSASLVSRANEVYRRINAGKTMASWWQRYKAQIKTTCILAAGLAVPLSCISIFHGEISLAAFSFDIAVSLLAAVATNFGYRLRLRKLIASMGNIDLFATYMYTGRTDEIGQLRFMHLANKSRLRTALGRFGASAHDLSHFSDLTAEQVRVTQQSMSKQREETDMLATAIHQMAQAINEAAQAASHTSSSTRDAKDEVSSGVSALGQGNQSMQKLSDTVRVLSESLTQLTANSQRISEVIEVIRSVAEQTNLLALNAAIEAARAGDHGRGFAVVADEVRTLAQRTQESTEHIEGIITNLTQTSDSASQAMEVCQQMTATSADELCRISTTFDDILKSVNAIEEMSIQIATATEEQSNTANEIMNNTVNIVNISNQVEEEANKSADLALQISDLAKKQFMLVERFHS